MAVRELMPAGSQVRGAKLGPARSDPAAFALVEALGNRDSVDSGETQLLDTRNNFLLPGGTRLKGTPSSFLDSRAALRDPSLPAGGRGLPALKRKRLRAAFPCLSEYVQNEAFI